MFQMSQIHLKLKTYGTYCRKFTGIAYFGLGTLNFLDLNINTDTQNNLK